MFSLLLIDETLKPHTINRPTPLLDISYYETKSGGTAVAKWDKRDKKYIFIKAEDIRPINNAKIFGEILFRIEKFFGRIFFYFGKFF